jgi:hypothetical protein
MNTEFLGSFSLVTKGIWMKNLRSAVSSNSLSNWSDNLGHLGFNHLGVGSVRFRIFPGYALFAETKDVSSTSLWRYYHFVNN